MFSPPKAGLNLPPVSKTIELRDEREGYQPGKVTR
jgi:hypothetical protein